MKNVRTVFVYRDAVDFFTIYISSGMIALFDYQALFPFFGRFVRKNRSEQTAAHDQIIIFPHNRLLQHFVRSKVYHRSLENGILPVRIITSF